MLKVGFCRIFNSKFRNYRFTVSLNSRFQKMNSNSFSGEESVSNDPTVFQDEGDPQKVFVLSRINSLAECFTTMKNDNETCSKMSVINIGVPAHTNFIKPLYVKNVEILICDPMLLSCNYQNMLRLKWAHSTWAGVEPLFQSIKEKPHFIVTKHTHEDFSGQIAEYVMMHVLMNERNYKEVWAAEVKKSWSDMKDVAECAPTRPLNKLTIGVLGVGNMGKAIAKSFKPFGTKVIGFARTPRASTEFGSFDSIEISLTYVLSKSDYVINTLPSTPETIGLLDGDVLQSCSSKKPCFINVGRGNIVQESTLLRALKELWLTHIILDVFEQEPLPRNSPLWSNKQISITPHCAAISKPMNIALDFIEAFKRYQQNVPLKNVVDWDKGY